MGSKVGKEMNKAWKEIKRPEEWSMNNRIPMKFKSRFHRNKEMRGGKTGGVFAMKFWN